MNKVPALPPAVFLMGPTASGKTDLALAMAAHWPVEVISVDSALVYRGMDIGTAKPDAGFLHRLPHFLIDIRNPDQAYSAADFRRDALPLMRDIAARGNIPLLVGGTMLYYKVLLEGIAELPATDEQVRKQVLEEADQLGWPALHEKLAAIDPVTAKQLHPNHSQRIQRALEVYYLTGEPMSVIQARQIAEPLLFNVLQLGLWPTDRAALHRRIAMRFEQMLARGFVEEVEHLRTQYGLRADMMSMRAVGYRQVWEFLEKRINRDQLVEQGIAATRQLAKRQFTWLRKWSNLNQLEIDFTNNNGVKSQNAPILSEISRMMDELVG